MSQSTFTVPKDRQDVTVCLHAGMKLEGSIFLDYAPEGTTVHHKAVAFLENGSNFFPLVLKDGSGTVFIQKKNMRFLQLHFGADTDRLNAELSLMQTVNITAIFTDETAVTGALTAEVPVEKARLSDCLNLADKFLNVRMDGSICYINKEAVQKVIQTPGA